MKTVADQRLWFPLVWFSLIPLASADPDPLNKHSRSGSALSNPALQVLVYNYASLSKTDLKVAQEVATTIYENVGIQIEWLDC